MKLKAYFWKPTEDDEEGIAVIAETVKEAKKIGWHAWGCEYGNDNEWIECSCVLNKDKSINIEGLQKGTVLDCYEGLRRGLYGYIEGECELCHNEAMLFQVYNGKCICNDCDEKTNEMAGQITPPSEGANALP